MKNRFLISILLLFGLLSAATANADTSTRGCETNTMKAGTFCNWAEGKSWCTNNTNTCAVESTTPCPANPTGGTYAFSCNTNTCILSCNTGYTNCTGTCKLNVSVPSNCTTFNQCTEVCSACAQGYELSGGACVGATLKLGSDSVGVSNYIFQTSAPVLTIPSTGNVGIGTTTPMAKLEIVPTSGYSILAGGFKIGNVGLPTADGDVTTKGYVDSIISTATSTFASLWDGTAGADIWSLNSGNVGIGTTTPKAKLNIYAGAGNGLKLNGFGTGDFYGIDLSGSGLSGSTDYLLYAAPTMYIRADGYMSFAYLYTSGYLRSPSLYHTAAMTIYTTSGSVTLGTASTTNIILNPASNVGIGTTNPMAKLEIIPTSGYSILAGNYKIGNVALPTANADAATKGYVDSTVAAATSSISSLWGGTTGGDIWSLNSGNVGIGTINPTEKLHIEGSGSYLGFLINNTAVGGRRWKLWATATGAGAGSGKLILYDDSAAQVRLTVDDTGNVGIGTTAPNNLLSVYDLVDFNNDDQNTRVGYQAGKNLKSGAYMNSFFGYQAGFFAASSTAAAISNTAIGFSTLYFNDTGMNNSAIGSTALHSNTKGRQNTAVGMSALYTNTIGEDNVAVGVGALNNNSSGNYNVALGAHALDSSTIAESNTAIGLSALGNITTGSLNTAIGMEAGSYVGAGSVSNTASDISIFIGTLTRALADGDSNEIVIGSNTIGNGSNSITFGNSNNAKTILTGNIGIGTTSPLAKLSVVPASGYSMLAGNYKIGNIALPTANSDAATKGYVDSALSTGYLPLSGGTMSGAINMGNNNITNLNTLTVNKITATTIDPLYTIKGLNYSTFAPSIAGGVKEEYTGKIGIYKLIATKEYEAVIDFASVKEGSDLWLWRQVVDYDKSSVDVAVTPYGRSAQVYYLIDGNKLIFRSDKAVEISYRLTAKRFDWRDWPTLSHDQTTRGLEVKY